MKAAQAANRKSLHMNLNTGLTSGLPAEPFRTFARYALSETAHKMIAPLVGSPSLFS